MENILKMKTNPYNIVDDFEKVIANLCGSKYAVSVDSCTNAIFLCLKYINNPEQDIIIPNKTYISIPSTIRNAGHKVFFEDIEWKGVYQLKPLPIFDGALRFKRNMYNGGFHCLSFHIKKHLKIGRGGMILTDDKEAYDWFKLARFNGRNSIEHKKDTFQMIGWNFYMTNYDAARGFWLLSTLDENKLEDIEPDYPDLSIYDFNNSISGGVLKLK
jgi:dTDP-4-amino-4,6-dideoxygalactose transaminase